MHDADQDHGHAHDGGVIYETRLLSVGIDVGSSTTHLTFSELVVGRRASHFHRKPEVLRRSIVYRSPIRFTPFLEDGRIDDRRLSEFVQNCYQEAGVKLENVNSGAVICTGEAARRRNAQVITETLAKDSGRFVCATAGHHFEALLAAHGSGSVEISHQSESLVINLDIGGGTAKRSLVRHGFIESTAAINVGARLIAMDENGIVTRVERAGQMIASSIGIEVALGKPLPEKSREKIAARMAEVLIDFLGENLDALGRDLLLTDAEPVAREPFHLVFSGGVSEFVYDKPSRDPGDLGPNLGRMLRAELKKRGMDEQLQRPVECIRATVIGAGQFTLQVSGETVHASRDIMLPMTNLTVTPALIGWDRLTVAGVEKAIFNALATVEEEEPMALFCGGPARFGYGGVQIIAEGAASAFKKSARSGPLVLIFSQNMAKTVGQAMLDFMPADSAFICLDELEVGKMDYLDIGAPPEGETYFPVVVKSLVFK